MNYPHIHQGPQMPPACSQIPPFFTCRCRRLLLLLDLLARSWHGNPITSTKFKPVFATISQALYKAESYKHWTPKLPKMPKGPKGPKVSNMFKRFQ